MPDLKIKAVAAQLHRSYSWVYQRLSLLDGSRYVLKARVFIKPAGVRRLAALNKRAPKRGRPRTRKVAGK